MQGRHSSLETLCVIILSFAVLLTYLAGNAGIWDPWEATTLLAARQMAQTNVTEAAFWIPSVDGELVFRPYIQLWLLSVIFHISPDPSIFMLRLPSAVAGILLSTQMFVTLRRVVSRQAAGVAVFVLLAIPVFIFGSRLIQGGIWPIVAVSFPILQYF